MCHSQPSSGYCAVCPSLGLLIPAMLSPGITPPTAEASAWSVLSVIHTPAWLSPPALSSSYIEFLNCAMQRGSPGTTVDKEKVFKFNEDGDILGEAPSPLHQSLEQCPSQEVCHSLPMELVMKMKMWDDATAIPGLLPAQTLAGEMVHSWLYLAPPLTCLTCLTCCIFLCFLAMM